MKHSNIPLDKFIQFGYREIVILVLHWIRLSKSWVAKMEYNIETLVYKKMLNWAKQGKAKQVKSKGKSFRREKYMHTHLESSCYLHVF